MYSQDKIITTNKFIGGKNYTGTFLFKQKTAYAVKFDKPINFKRRQVYKDVNATPELHNLNNHLNSNTGFYLRRNEFIVKSLYKNKNKNKQDFIYAFNAMTLDGKQTIKNEITKEKQRIIGAQNEIKYFENNIKTYTNTIEKNKRTIDLLSKKQREKIDLESFGELYEKLKKHKRIKDILIKEEGKYLIVITNDLEYTGNVNFNLGSYIFFISLQEKNCKAINYTKQYMKGSFHHPCIDKYGSICMGSEISYQIREAFRIQDFISIIYTLLHFLQKPNYDEPHISDKLFQYLQPVTLKPKNIFKFLDPAYWRKNEKWDNDKYKLNIN